MISKILPRACSLRTCSCIVGSSIIILQQNMGIKELGTLGIHICITSSFIILVITTIVSCLHMLNHLRNLRFFVCKMFILVILFTPMMVGWCAWLPIQEPGMVAEQILYLLRTWHRSLI